MAAFSATGLSKAKDHTDCCALYVLAEDDSQLVFNGTVLLVCHSFTNLERANLLLDTISLQRSQVSITENGLYVPGECLLVEDYTLRVRKVQESPRTLSSPSEINDDIRVLQYTALLQHLRQTVLNTPPIKDASNKQHNALAYAAFKDCILESHALMGPAI